MLIEELCDYYDILKKRGELSAPEGYSIIKADYKICLTEDGRIDEIISFRKPVTYTDKKGNTTVKYVARETIVPERGEFSTICSNYLEYRPVYVFGMNKTADGLSADDRTGKARKAHRSFVDVNLAFIDGIDTPVVNAYRNFLINWVPENETKNEKLLGMGNEYKDAYKFVFCFSGEPDKLLHEDPEIKTRWEQIYSERQTQDNEETVIGICSITGESLPIARTHRKIKGMPGTQTDPVLVGCNNTSEESYNHTQGYNSGISEKAVKKYTDALNYLLSSPKHHINVGDTTIVFWATDDNKEEDELLCSLLSYSFNEAGAEQTDNILYNLIKQAASGMLNNNAIKELGIINPNVNFCMTGLKINVNRLVPVFTYKKKAASFLKHIADFQESIQMCKNAKPVSMRAILYSVETEAEINGGNNKGKTVLISELFKSVISGTQYPLTLYRAVLDRIKNDMTPTAIRTGIIKACLNNIYKEDITMELNEEKTDAGYLCGRLFAVIERLHEDVSFTQKNGTEGGNKDKKNISPIRSTYYTKASTAPGMVFPRLVQLAQYYLKQSKHSIYFDKLMGEITEKIESFPMILSLNEQGNFVVGYYQQRQSFFNKNSGDTDTEVQEEQAEEILQ